MSGRCRHSSTTQAAQRCSNEVAGTWGGARPARWRKSRSRSSTRAPRPKIQLFNVRMAMPSRLATLLSLAPSHRTWAAASNTTSTPVTLPGSASQGSTRSRCRQSRQRASATQRVLNSSGVSIRRATRLPVSARSLPPQAAQRHPQRRSSPALATAVQ